MGNTHTIRRLAAVLFADVVGYTRLMAEDEDSALAALNRFRESTFDPAVTQHNGRIVKLMGDGALVEFGSVLDAVDCAIAVQTEAAAPNRPDALKLRIGVNLGDIIIQDDDIYGDGVNIASRLEAQAQPGGVCISSVVNESVRGRTGAAFIDGGAVEVKNIPRPIRVWRWHPEDVAPPDALADSQAPAAAPKRRSETASIAVLPLENMSRDAEQAYFSDGISEDIITDLSKVPGLLVIARNSSFAYRGKAVDLRTVGLELGVGHILEGSVRRAGERVRITAQLIDAASGGHIWADRYDRELDDIFAVQDEVTLKIVDALKVRLTSAEKEKISSAGTASTEAHDNFLRMRNLLLSPGLNPENWKRAMAYGARAIEQDPSYAQALALSSVFNWLDWHNGWSGDTQKVIAERARDLAERAIANDPDEPLANVAVGVGARWAGDYDRASAAVERAISFAPDLGLCLFSKADVALGAGRPEEAIAALERAIRLDPAWSHQHLQFLGMAHFLHGNYETAALILRERILQVADTDVGRAWLAAALGHLGEIEEAREVWADLLKIKPDFAIAPRLARFLFARPADPESVLAGLAKAGLPAPDDQNS